MTRSKTAHGQKIPTASPPCDEIFLVPERGARANDAHVANEDIQNLRQFVKAALSQEFADTRDVLFRFVQKVCRHIMRRIHFHGAEFVHGKERFPFSDTLLRKQNRPGIVKKNRKRNQKV